jgi:putative transposase
LARVNENVTQGARRGQGQISGQIRAKAQSVIGFNVFLTMREEGAGMAHYIRPRIVQDSIWFTVALADRGSTLLIDEVERLRVAVRQTMADRPFRADAWVVLPDHMHCVWTLPLGDNDYALRWGAIKARFSRDLCRAGFTPPPLRPEMSTGRYRGIQPHLRHDKGEVAFWQRRFWEHHIRDEDELAACIRYCWHNPVKHGFVTSPADWPFSSWHRDVGRAKDETAPAQAVAAMAG